MWAEPSVGGRFRLRNVPFYTYEMSYDDTVVASESQDGWVFQYVAERGGHSTYRIFVSNTESLKRFSDFWARLERIGCTLERATERLFAVDVPPEADIHKAYEVLQSGEMAGVWDFEEAREHARLCSDAFNRVGLTLNRMPERLVDDIHSSEKVATVLLIRLSNDLLCASLLARRGYALQAVTLVAAIYEAAFTIAYLGSDEERARNWIEHEDPTRSFMDMRSMTKEGLAKLGTPDPDAQANVEYKVYRQLCMGKHSNPLLQKRYGYQRRESSVFAMNGPDTSESSVRAAWLALEHGAALTYIALSSFFLSHLPKDLADELCPQLENIGAHRKKLEAKAKERWGTEDPFPGKWRVDSR
ncbi:MAG: DUF4265 domain-containing protein [Vicinamibacteria bacterium]